jgi:hypothetical protein
MLWDPIGLAYEIPGSPGSPKDILDQGEKPKTPGSAKVKTDLDGWFYSWLVEADYPSGWMVTETSSYPKTNARI